MISILDLDENLSNFYFEMNHLYIKFIQDTEKRILDMTIEQCNTFIKKLPTKPIELSKDQFKYKFLRQAESFATPFLFQTPHIPIIEPNKELWQKKNDIRNEVFSQWDIPKAILKYCQSLNKAFQTL